MSKTTQKDKNLKIVIPRGKFKSGRVWKTPKERFSSIKKTRGLKIANSFEKQMKRKEELQHIKTISRARDQLRQEAKEQKKQRRRENLERQKQNQLKSEIVQVITNSAKIKRMKRKQLRSIQKRDTSTLKK